MESFGLIYIDIYIHLCRKKGKREEKLKALQYALNLEARPHYRTLLNYL